MKYEIAGRRIEIKKLKNILTSREAEFVAVYGRRRVGKTYLVRQFFNAESPVFFEVTGLKEGRINTQIDLFCQAVEESFYNGSMKIERPKRWMDALKILTTCIENSPKNKKIVLFFDELPWLATRKSGVLQALDYYWNTRWSKHRNVKLIVCGSAASWMLENLIYAKGGLHNRITGKIHLLPFTLKETQEYLKYRGINYNQWQTLQLYMAIGGIPHYLKSVTGGLSATQNIDRICFQRDGLLLDEFDNLFASLFDYSEAHNEIIKVLAGHRQGLSREDLLKKSQRSTSGGTFKKRLLELEQAGFIAAFVPYKHTNKGIYYRIIDEYTLFYLNWIQPIRKRLQAGSANYWESKSQTPAWKSWAGYAFEAVCFKHIRQICSALDIASFTKEIGSWRYISAPGDNSPGVQIDLLIDRSDGIINICEIKHYSEKFSIDKSYARQLEYKLNTFKKQTGNGKQLFLTMITANGLARNKYSNELVANEITLKDLFE